MVRVLGNNRRVYICNTVVKRWPMNPNERIFLGDKIPFDDLGLLCKELPQSSRFGCRKASTSIVCRVRNSSKLDPAKTTVVARITRGNCTVINVIPSSEYHNIVFISTNKYVGYTEGKSPPTST